MTDVVEYSYNQGLDYNYIKSSLCLIQSVRHLKCCHCYNEKFQQIYSQMYAEEIKQQKQDPTLTKQRKQLRIDNLPDLVYTKIFNNIVNRKKGYPIYCTDEVEQISSTIEMFRNKYDFSDPRVVSIVRSVIDYQLTAIRMMKESNYEGVLLRNNRDDFVLNPVEESKRKYNDSLVNAINTLDRIFEGEKSVVVNIDNDHVFDRKAMYGFTDSDTDENSGNSNGTTSNLNDND